MSPAFIRHFSDQTSRRSARNSTRRFIPAAVATVAALSALAFSGCGKAEKSTAPAASASATPAAPTVPDSIKKLLGRWNRTDGEYTLSLVSAETGGVLKAEYFNPNPIHVSRAAWLVVDDRVQVFVELNDVGYPGATYVLVYDAASGRLGGQYTQPSQQQTYDIEFTRAPAKP